MSSNTVSMSTTHSPLLKLLRALTANQVRARRSISLVPSENVLSPLARLPFVLDGYSRYFFDHMNKFGAWMFFGGIELGSVEFDVVIPELQRMTEATHVNVQPLSGLNCMTIAMASLCPDGGIILTVPVTSGGHMSSSSVAYRLGIEAKTLPMTTTHDVNIEALSNILKNQSIKAIYLDQSHVLFPIDSQAIRETIDQFSPETLLHFDSSHLNGLILGNAMANPLKCGAHSFGGSTHKTLPGPHKGFLATNNDKLAKRFNEMSGHFVSHHQTAAVASLGITLLEMTNCSGDVYAARILENAKILAHTMQRRGVSVACETRDFTECHQVWVNVSRPGESVNVAQRLYEGGISVNRFDELPGMPGASLRLSSAEITRLGAGAEETHMVANLIADVIVDNAKAEDIAPKIKGLRQILSSPKYCYKALPDNSFPELPQLSMFLEEIHELITIPLLPRSIHSDQ